jgi:hypothetical protein
MSGGHFDRKKKQNLYTYPDSYRECERLSPKSMRPIFFDMRHSILIIHACMNKISVKSVYIMICVYPFFSAKSASYFF